MYDRRVDGEALVFGNEGAYYDDALVFWDHETETLWTQWTGTGLEGALKGVRLALIPTPLLSWTEWREEHPESLVLAGEAS